MIGVLLLAACGTAPFEPYYVGDGPTLTGVSPATVLANVQGQTLRIEGTGLAETSVVVIGGRNAEILSVAGDSVEVLIPEPPPGGGSVELAVATADGIARLDDALQYEVPLAGVIASETASLAVVIEDCEDCGAERARVRVSGWVGREQPGYALELAGLSLAQLPPPGQVRSVGPMRATAVAFVPQPTDLSVSLVADRDWDAELQRLSDRRDALYAIESDAPIVLQTLDEDGCPADTVDAVSGAGGALTVDRPPGSVGPAWLGFSAGATTAFTATASVEGSGTVLTDPVNGLVTRYDVDLGELVAVGVAGRVGLDDVRPGAVYDVVRTQRGATEVLGQVSGLLDLEVDAVWLGDDLSVSAEASADGVTVVEVIASDPDAPLLGEPAIVGRLLGQVEGTGLTVLASQLDTLPQDAVLTVRVTRHQVRAVPWSADGELVVDIARSVIRFVERP